MDINKQFWETVKKEYETDTCHSYYLCHRSPTFNKKWLQKEKDGSLIKEILALGEEFIREHPELAFQYGLWVGSEILLKTPFENHEFVKPTRTAFLEWVIKQY